MASSNDDDPVLRLKNNLVNIWKSSEYSDLLIRCNNGDEHRVHRVVLCSQSDFFRRACNPKTGFKEALSGVIELQNDDPDAVRAMLQFCYTFTYTCKPSDTQEDRMVFHVHMYAVGEIYDLPGLKRLAAKNFDQDVAATFPRFPAAVRAIYETTPSSDRGLRDVVLRVCANNARDLLLKPPFEDMMDELGVFGRELARTLAERAPAAAPGSAKSVPVDCRKYRCGVCRRAVAWNIPKPCPTELINCMFCGAGFSPSAWKKRVIKPDDPLEPEDVVQRPASVVEENGFTPAGW